MPTGTFEIKVDSTLENKDLFYHLFQPIYHLSTWNIYGFEALLRTPNYDPNTLFKKARSQKELYQLDIHSIKLAVERFTETSSPYFLYINIFCSTIVHSSFLSDMETILANRSISPKKIVLEINELGYTCEPINLFIKVISILREYGLRIALDDVGKETSVLPSMINLEPDVIKLDKSLSCELFPSREKQKLLKRIIDFCGNDIQLVLEGMEKPDDLAIAKSLGVPFGQGYILGKPQNL